MIMSDSLNTRVIIVRKKKLWKGLARTVSIYRRQGRVWQRGSRTRVDSPGARAAKYRRRANRQPGWDKRAGMREGGLVERAWWNGGDCGVKDGGLALECGAGS